MKNKGVILLFFDLPTVTKENKREYRRFIKNIKSDGYRFFQESVYYKLLGNSKLKEYDINRLEKFTNSKEGHISFIILPINLFINMKTIVGAGLNLNIDQTIIIE